MKQSTDRILTTHTGSLPRTAPMLAQLRARRAGQAVDEAAFRKEVTSAVTETVNRQIRCGVDVVNDGEQGKPDYSTYIRDRLTGFDGEPVIMRGARDQAEFPDYAQAQPGQGRPSGPACNGPISWKDFSATQRDLDNLAAAIKAHPPAGEAFMTAVSPGQAARFMPNRYYKSHEDYLHALAAVLADEYKAIADAGFILQVDCPDLASGWNNQHRNLSVPEFVKVVEMHVEVLNNAVKDIPADRMRLHLCWGNYEGPHNHDIPLADIIRPVLKARPAGLSFEGANPRHAHEWRVFDTVKLPAGKVLIPGVLDSTTNFIEHPELVADRICQYAKLVGRENVIAGSDCGFATAAEGSRIFPTIAWAKLSAMSEGTRIASKRLW